MPKLFLGPLSFRYVGIGFENRDRSKAILSEGPTTGHGDLGSVPFGVDQFSFPPTGSSQNLLGFGNGYGMDGVEKVVGHASDSFMWGYAVELICPEVPERDDIGLEIANENGIVGQVEQGCLPSTRFFD